MELTQSFGFFDEWLLFDGRQWFPLLAQIFWNHRVMHVGCFLANFSTLNLTPDHKWVHRSLYMARAMLFCLQKNRKIEKSHINQFVQLQGIKTKKKKQNLMISWKSNFNRLHLHTNIIPARAYKIHSYSIAFSIFIQCWFFAMKMLSIYRTNERSSERARGNVCDWRS